MPALAVAFSIVCTLLLQVVFEVLLIELLQLSFDGWAKTRVEKNNEMENNNMFLLQVTLLNKIAFIKDFNLIYQDILEITEFKFILLLQPCG